MFNWGEMVTEVSRRVGKTGDLEHRGHVIDVLGYLCGCCEVKVGMKEESEEEIGA